MLGSSLPEFASFWRSGKISVPQPLPWRIQPTANTQVSRVDFIDLSWFGFVRAIPSRTTCNASAVNPRFRPVDPVRPVTEVRCAAWCAMPWTSCFVAPALLIQTAPTTQAHDPLRELVATSELIAWVRVEDVRLLDLGDGALLRHLWPHGDVPYAQLSVDSIVFGDGDPTSLLVFVGDATAPSGGPLVGVGERALVFLERDLSLDWRLRRSPSPGATEFVAGRRSWAIRPGGIWRGTRDGERLQRASLVPPLSLEVGREAFVDALELALDLELPRFEATLVSNGPRPFRVAIRADGRLTGSREGEVEPQALRALWGAVEFERFHELPRLVGESGGPCLTAMDLCIVTRRSRRNVGIVLGGIDRIPEGELREATHRALRIWDAVPVPERPVLR